MNRDGAGVLAHEVHGLAADILSVGWNDQEPRPIAIELDEVQSQQVEQFNHRLVANSSSGLFPLAPVGPGPGTVKYGSVSASHTNSVLRLFRNGCSINISERTAELRDDRWEAVVGGVACPRPQFP